jgi:hypothetical protein
MEKWSAECNPQEAEAEAIAKAEVSEIVENSVGPKLCRVFATEEVRRVQGREAGRRPRKPRKRIVRKFTKQSEKRFQLIVRGNKNKMEWRTRSNKSRNQH